MRTPWYIASLHVKLAIWSLHYVDGYSRPEYHSAHLSPQRKSTTLLRAAGFAAFYLLAGVAFLLMALNAAYPTIRPLSYPIQWALLFIGTMWFGAALIISARRSRA